jgi:hypothetical protein
VLNAPASGKITPEMAREVNDLPFSSESFMYSHSRIDGSRTIAHGAQIAEAFEDPKRRQIASAPVFGMRNILAVPCIPHLTLHAGALDGLCRRRSLNRPLGLPIAQSKIT